MYEMFKHALRENRQAAASRRLAATKHERDLEVELLLGGIALPGCLAYDARADLVTFTLKKKPSSPPGES